MRIVAGIYGGRKLLVPKGKDIRPTSDKIRGAIMNMLRARGAITDAVVLDSFCGTGALGLEAISQGARSCVFMDTASESLDLAKQNSAALGLSTAQFLRCDATKAPFRPATSPPATLVFLDPPYKKELLLPSLQSLKQNDWLADLGWIVAESESKLELDWPEYVSPETEKVYGETKITLLQIN